MNTNYCVTRDGIFMSEKSCFMYIIYVFRGLKYDNTIPTNSTIFQNISDESVGVVKQVSKLRVFEREQQYDKIKMKNSLIYLQNVNIFVIL